MGCIHYIHTRLPEVVPGSWERWLYVDPRSPDVVQDPPVTRKETTGTRWNKCPHRVDVIPREAGKVHNPRDLVVDGCILCRQGPTGHFDFRVNGEKGSGRFQVAVGGCLKGHGSCPPGCNDRPEPEE